MNPELFYDCDPIALPRGVLGRARAHDGVLVHELLHATFAGYLITSAARSNKSSSEKGHSCGTAPGGCPSIAVGMAASAAA